ncbi:MAG: glycoside hydrolase family 127 protein [Clostridia bacterium]|nr:glycoside hydrolase family 127 protein [Clostridia bacterium]
MKRKYTFFTTKELRPAGWMERQLRLQAEGLNGNLDKVWPDVRDSMWIGGDREGWERVPYWLDGFIPLAYLLDDADMKARAKKYVDKILEFQKPDGWICPNGNTPIEKYDTWAILLISKTLTVYYDCTEDERIPDALFRMMKNYYELLSSGRIQMFEWASHRWYEGFIALDRLAAWYPQEAWIRELAAIFKGQGTDYAGETEKWKIPLNEWTQETHIVNLAMMLKAEAVSCELLGEDYTDVAERLYTVLDQYNGTAVGTFTGDECLSGISPIQGTELCAVVEQMYSLEHLYAYTGDPKWAERLEKVSFNALPATLSDDMWSHQYVQMVNQIDCTPLTGNPPFRTNGREAHMFGLEPHFGCCTANFGQGWPKLALSALMKAEDGVVSAVPIPAVLTTEWNGVPVKITLKTDYPFRNRLTYCVEASAPTDLRLHVRIPSFAKNLTVNGQRKAKRSLLTFSGFGAGETELVIDFEATPKIVARPNRMSAVEYGSLVFALPVESKITTREYTRKDVERKFPYCDYHLSCASDWSYGLASRCLTVEEREVDEIPFSSQRPPLVIQAELAPIDWGMEEGYRAICAKTPHSRKALAEKQTRALVPYGCAKLRVTELPIVKA